MYVCIRVCMYVHSHTHISSPVLYDVHVLYPALACTYAATCISWYAHTLPRACTGMHILWHAHAQASENSSSHVQAQAHTHTRMCIFCCPGATFELFAGPACVCRVCVPLKGYMSDSMSIKHTENQAFISFSE